MARANRPSNYLARRRIYTHTYKRRRILGEKFAAGPLEQFQRHYYPNYLKEFW
jgi:hypothetical protein